MIIIDLKLVQWHCPQISARSLHWHMQQSFCVFEVLEINRLSWINRSNKSYWKSKWNSSHCLGFVMDKPVAQQIIVLTTLVFPCQYTPPVLHTRWNSSANDTSYNRNPDNWRFRHFSPFVLRNPRIDLRPRSRLSRKRPTCEIWISRSGVKSPGTLPQTKPRKPPSGSLPLNRCSHSRIRSHTM